MLKIEPIGWIHSCFKECFGTPRQGTLAPSSEARLELAPALQSQGFFSGLENFSHVWLVWHFHRNESWGKSGKVYPPRLAGEKVGVFASRSPHRPNPLGITLSRLVSVEENSLLLSGIDLIGGTPVFDVKPYLPEADQVENPRGGWTENLSQSRTAVIFSDSATATLAKISPPIPVRRFQNLIVELIELDPRPESSKGIKNIFYFQLYDWDIGFSWTETSAIVTEIRPAR